MIQSSIGMELSEILQCLERNDGHFQRQAVQEAIARREEIVPALLRILEQVADDPQRFASQPDYMALTYAMFLLALFRERRAYPLLVRIFSTPGEVPFDLVGDVVTENLGNILASVSGGDTSGLAALIENEQVNEYVRSAALKGVVTLVACGQQSRDEIMAYFAGLFRTLERTYSAIWGSLACCCTDLCPEEVFEEIRQAYEEGLVESFCIAWHEVEEAAALGKEQALKDLSLRRYRLVTDVAAAMEWWACFDKDNARRRARALDRRYPWPGPRAPVQAAKPKVGRNEPCPCGSGKKFKKCCGP
jgi:hypothetical protein